MEAAREMENLLSASLSQEQEISRELHRRVRDLQVSFCLVVCWFDCMSANNTVLLIESKRELQRVLIQFCCIRKRR